ncbi:hypothetical protein [Nonomuraea candida]|uniref:hypothetical protein n=1 Tax=Nonomuraea candida TaxID=359159 RepID=UPI000AE81F96|nr:hypothetical protein [Nonomuraea candida]
MALRPRLPDLGFHVTAHPLRRSAGPGQGGVIKKCWIRVPVVQPLMKTALEDRTGALDEDLLTQVQGRVAQYLGLLG